MASSLDFYGIQECANKQVPATITVSCDFPLAFFLLSIFSSSDLLGFFILLNFILLLLLKILLVFGETESQ